MWKSLKANSEKKRGRRDKSEQTKHKISICKFLQLFGICYYLLFYHNKKVNYMLVFIPTRACFWLRKVYIFRRSSLLQEFTAVVQRDWHSLPFLCWFLIILAIPVYTYVHPLHSGAFVAYSSFTLVSFCFIAVSFQLVPVYCGTILVHSVSFRRHSASFWYIPFRSVPFLCLVTPLFALEIWK